MSRCFLVILSAAVLLCGSSFADIPEVDLDLTMLSGNLLTDSIAAIREDPEAYAGRAVRIRGQYYASSAGAEVQRSLIVVCSTSSCVEVGLRLAPAEGTVLTWPEVNSEMEITGTLEIYDTAFGTLGIRVAVHSLLPL